MAANYAIINRVFSLEAGFQEALFVQTLKFSRSEISVVKNQLRKTTYNLLINYFSQQIS